MSATDFSTFFSKAFPKPRSPYGYQCRLACGPEAVPPKLDSLIGGTKCESRIINIPTGLGKTAAVTSAWLWNRVHLGPADWPRRLVYCLPMRTLVEQTHAAAGKWVDSLAEAGLLPQRPGIHLLMGGEDAGEWDIYPERDAILIGTQDMLLSRALNRGYGMSRFRWPMHYALLNNDCLWVFDEVQLMGSGLPTTAQLAAFRRSYGTANPSMTWWMSATSSPDWLNTVDFGPATLAPPLCLDQPSDLNDENIIRLREARKEIHHCKNSTAEKELPKLAAEIVDQIKTRPGLTLVVVNTVKKAKALHAALTKQLARTPVSPILLHSQFRPEDRKDILHVLLGSEHASTIAVSTQIVEAGVDISAHTLFTEMAPWSSLIQRFGRCNRRGTDKDATIHVIPADKPVPYQEEQLKEAKHLIDQLIESGHDASPKNLSAIPIPECDKPASKHVIRKRDFIDLFDTTPDLAGNDIDIERWVRDADDSKVSLFWRTWEGSAKNLPPPQEGDFPAPLRNELCPAPLGETRDWVDKSKLPLRRWDHLSSKWELVPKEFGKSTLVPGQIYLLPAESGGYTPQTGFDPKSTESVAPVAVTSTQTSDATSGDILSEGSWQSIAVHTDHVVHELSDIIQSLGIDLEALLHAARWHDLGKAHAAFRAKIDTILATSAEASLQKPHAKAPRSAWLKSLKNIPEARKHFRHELASALAILQPAITTIPEEQKDLVAWLIATHHGKIRLSIRSLPEETPADDPTKRFARGVWDRDPLEPVPLGEGITSPAITLSLEPMELGLCIEPPFEGKPSWTERMLTLRDHKDIGPLRLAFWETLLRAADERASAKHP